MIIVHIYIWLTCICLYLVIFVMSRLIESNFVVRRGLRGFGVSSWMWFLWYLGSFFMFLFLFFLKSIYVFFLKTCYWNSFSCVISTALIPKPKFFLVTNSWFLYFTMSLNYLIFTLFFSFFYIFNLCKIIMLS